MKIQGQQRLLLLSLAVALVSVISPCGAHVPEQEVVVVGGGMAGLAAARQILNRGRGRFSVRVFEARRERYGGRVWTNTLKNPKARGLEVDLGGSTLNVVNQWDDALLNLTRDFELETASVSRAQFSVPWLNKKYSDDELMQAMIKASSILTDAINASRHRAQDESVRSAVDRQLGEGGVGGDSLPALLLRSLPSYVLSQHSARHYMADSLDFGYERVLLDGMGAVVDRLVSGTEDEAPLKIDLRTAVRQIMVDKSRGKVTLRLKDGSQVTVDKVIVAVPAPVMANELLLFEPPLPKEYQAAVSQIGMSDGNKVIVEFDVAFWPSEFGVFMSACERDEDRGYLQTWLNVQRLLGKPVLQGFVQGEAARLLETLTDQELTDVVVQRLQTIFGADSVSAKNIVNMQRSAWTSDQWAGGASSYPRVGDSPELWDTLAEPLCPNVYFAGEHTVFKGHGTLHGAYASGLRAADQLLSGYCEEKAKEEEKRRRRKAEEKRKAELKKKKKEQGEDVQEEVDASQGAGDTDTDAKDEL